jgi:hypothetical protein
MRIPVVNQSYHLLRRTFSSSFGRGDIVNNRSILLFDPRVPLQASLREQKNENFSQQLKHPESSHVLSAYSKYSFQNAVYDYNKIGEFQLTMGAAEYHLPLPLKDNAAPSKIISQNLSHDMLILPDCILLKNLKNEDIPRLFPLLNSSNRISTTSFDKANLSSEVKIISLDSSSSSSTKPTTLEPLIMLLNVHSKSFPLQKCHEIIEWFQESVSEFPSLQKKAIEYIITTDYLSQHQLVQFCFLPTNDHYSGIFTKQQMRKIVEKFSLQMKKQSESF